MYEWALKYGLKLLPYLIVAGMLTGGLLRYGSYRDTIGNERRWSEDFVRELNEDMAQARLADDQLWRTRISDFTMLVASVVRDNAYLRYRAAAEQLTDGLSDRVWDAERRLQACAVPGPGAGNGAGATGPEGSEGPGRLRALEQRVYDACAADGAALMSLAVKPLCECPTQ